MTESNEYGESINLHQERAGKIEITSKVDVTSEEDLSFVYTPGVSAVCRAIAEDETKVNTLTARGNMIAVITDGTAVLGLGDIGPKAAIHSEKTNHPSWGVDQGLNDCMVGDTM